MAWIEVQSVGAVALAATTVLIVPGTGTSDPSVAHNFESNAYQNFIDPGARGCTDNACPGVIFVPVPYDASLWPVISSQGATVASAEKAALAGLTPQDKNRLAFVLIANPNRPNGGIIERPVRFGEIPVADISFGPPTPTDAGIATTDIAMQYDGISDFPAYPLNVLADANALLGTLLIHPSYRNAWCLILHGTRAGPGTATRPALRSGDEPGAARPPQVTRTSSMARTSALPTEDRPEQRSSMKKTLAAAARVAAAGVSGLAFVAVIGSGTAQAAPQDCRVERDLFGASATCQPDGGSNYVLHVDCFGLYANGPFPMYTIGGYTVLSYPFEPMGQRISAACTGMGPGVVAAATNAYVEIYRG